MLVQEKYIEEALSKGEIFELKENLLEHHDFEAISRHIYFAFYQWYGCDFEITRILKRDPSDPTKCYLELYPSKCT